MIGLACRCLRHTLRIIPLLPPLLALTWCVTLLIYQEGDSAAWASQLFQSPVLPEEVPAPRPTPEKVPPPTVRRPQPTPIPLPLPTQPPPPVQPVEPGLPPAPSEIVPPEEQPTLPPVLEQPAPVQPPVQPPTEPPTQLQPPAPPPSPYNSSSPSEIVIDSGLLIDSILVYISYLWLCCGVIAFITIPVAFLVLYVLGVKRSKNLEA